MGPGTHHFPHRPCADRLSGVERPLNLSQFCGDVFSLSEFLPEMLCESGPFTGLSLLVSCSPRPPPSVTC